MSTVLIVVGAAVLLAIGVSLWYAYIRFKQYREKLREEAPKPVSLLSTRKIMNNGNPARYNEELELFFKETRDNTRKYVKDNLLPLYVCYIEKCKKSFKFVPAEAELSFNVVIDNLVADAFERFPADKDFTMTEGGITLDVHICFAYYWDKRNDCRSQWRYIKVIVSNAELK